MGEISNRGDINSMFKFSFSKIISPSAIQRGGGLILQNKSPHLPHLKFSNIRRVEEVEEDQGEDEERSWTLPSRVSWEKLISGLHVEI